MSYLITKATLKMISGDKLVMREKISTPDLEHVRADLNRAYDCSSVLFVYEQEEVYTPAIQEK